MVKTKVECRVVNLAIAHVDNVANRKKKKNLAWKFHEPLHCK